MGFSFFFYEVTLSYVPASLEEGAKSSLEIDGIFHEPLKCHPISFELQAHENLGNFS
jgi:hypothetical protein